MDAADYAQEIEEQQRADALAAHAGVAGETPFEIEGVRVCLDCFEPIGAPRLAAHPHAVRCCECQDRRERARC